MAQGADADDARRHQAEGGYRARSLEFDHVHVPLAQEVQEAGEPRQGDLALGVAGLVEGEASGREDDAAVGPLDCAGGLVWKATPKRKTGLPRARNSRSMMREDSAMPFTSSRLSPTQATTGLRTARRPSEA